MLLPEDFNNKNAGPGHKKDLCNIKNWLINHGFNVDVYYISKFTVKSENGVINKNVFSFIRHLHSSKSLVILGPYYKFRYIIPFFSQETIVYVADSALKTSFLDFIKKPWTVHRVIYNFLSEFFLRGKKTIVASLEEFAWFSSSGMDIENLFLLFPIPRLNEKTYNDEHKNSNTILFYNPSGKGVFFAEKLITKLISVKPKINIIITGKNGNCITRCIKDGTGNVCIIPYVENIDELINSVSCVVLTDIGGSGLCNRAVQVRINNTKLICTLDSIRGTPLYYDDGVFVIYDENDFINAIDSFENDSKENDTHLVYAQINKFDIQMKRLAEKCILS